MKLGSGESQTTDVLLNCLHCGWLLLDSARFPEVSRAYQNHSLRRWKEEGFILWFSSQLQGWPQGWWFLCTARLYVHGHWVHFPGAPMLQHQRIPAVSRRGGWGGFKWDAVRWHLPEAVQREVAPVAAAVAWGRGGD